MITTIEQDGFFFKGDLVATREEFYFSVTEVIEQETGRVFSSVDEVNEACEMLFDKEKLAYSAAAANGLSMP